ncbi:MAG: AAA family ATPase [Chloroflexota bacterium]|nr:AAA family ATPase [Chloroflexota bacterium]
MTVLQAINTKTADAATPAANEPINSYPLQGKSLSTHSYCNENNVVSQATLESLAYCQYTLGQVTAEQRRPILDIFTDIQEEATGSVLYFAVQRKLMANSQLNHAVQQVLRQMETNGQRTSWSYQALHDAALPPIRWTVSQILPEGICLLGGRPKVGKSLLAMAAAKSVGEGSPFLKQNVEQGAVLYLALEDNARRFRARSFKQKWSAAAQVDIEFEWPDLGLKGYAQLARALEDKAYKLVVIDTLSRAADFNQNSVADASYVLGNLQRLALEHHTTLLIIDHLRKRSRGGEDSFDVIEDMLGSTGKVAVADAILGLFTKRRSTRSRFVITGRDLSDQKLMLELDTETLSWQLVGEAEQVAHSDMEQALLEAFQSLGGTSYTSELANHVSRDTGQVSRVLAHLVEQGLVIRGELEGRKRLYHFPAAETSAES